MILNKQWSEIIVGLLLLTTVNYVYGQGAPEGEVINPILEKHADNITFYINFDNSDFVPALAAGSPKIRSQQGKATFEKGLLGKSLRSGFVNLEGGKNVDFSVPGTWIFWISPWKWDRKKKPGYFWPFIAFLKGMKVQVGRQAAATWAKTRMYAYITAPKKLDSVYLPVYGEGGGKGWEDGTWHMIALTWNSDDLGLSVDGKPQAIKTLPKPLTGVNWFRIGTAKEPRKEDQVLTDEIVILNKRLTDAELKSLYDETLKVSKSQK